MGMRNYAEYGIGLVLTDNKLSNGKSEIDTLVEAFGCEDVYELAETKENDDHVWRFYNEEDEGKHFSPFADDKPFDEEPETMLVIVANRWYKPFEAAYTGPDEIRKEFQDAVGKYLPEDFDWDAHIGEFSCTVYR